MLTLGIGVFACALLASVLGTGWLRTYAIRRSVLDVPNVRSSHTVPTPRGGGGAIVLVVLIVSGWLLISGRLPFVPAIVLIVGGAVLALVGWLDDHHSLSAGLRGGIHLLVALLAVYAIRFLPGGGFPWNIAELADLVFCTLAIAWLINLYNFMDGSDGFAGGEACSVALGGALLFMQTGQAGWGLLALGLAAASLGFLRWNWAPARIFMGDVGSCFIGYVFGVLALVGERDGSVPAMTWLILLAVFIWDASFTLVRRVLAGERWYTAHRSHAYQRLVQMGCSHRRLAVLLLGYNILVLWPLAYASAIWKNHAGGVALASVLVTGAIWLTINRLYLASKGLERNGS